MAFRMSIMRSPKTYFKCLVLFLCFTATPSFDYNDLRNISQSCFKQGTCRVQPRNRLDLSLDWKDTNCFCDDECIKYSDCCLDANAYDKDSMRLNSAYECIDVPITGSYYMKGTCSPRWTGQDIERLCHQADPAGISIHNDPFLDIPTTSHGSGVTYKNFYCAVCNNEDTSSLEIWNARFSSPTPLPFDEEFIKENIRYIDGTWGIYEGENDTLSFRSLSVFPSVPDTVVHKIRQCVKYRNTCAESWTNEHIEELCHSYTTVVYGPALNFSGSLLDLEIDSELPFVVYRNYHCAKCNYVNDSEITCYIRDFRLFKHYSPVSFSVLFDFGVKKSVCRDGEIWDAFAKTCRIVVCLRDNREFRGGRCVKFFDRMVTFENATDGNTTESSLLEACDTMFFNQTDITEGDNGTVIINSYRRTYEEHEYQRYEDGILVCIPNNYSRLMGWLTLSGLGLSCVCILIHLVTFCIIPDLRNLSGKNLASLCISLFLAYICFLITTFREDSLGSCQVLASLMYYFFLASFAWMNVMSFDVWRTLQLATSELRVTHGKQWKKFSYYSLYAWMFPAVALTVVLVIDNVLPTKIDSSYLPQLGERLCWFGQRNGILIYFAAPLAFIMTMNIVFFFMAVRIVAMTSRSSNRISSSRPQQTQLKLYLRLALLMGLSWISGIVAGYIQEEYLWYLFILLNAFQGAFILLAFTCTKKVYRALGPFSWSFKSSFRESLQKRISGSSHVLESKDSNHSQLSNTCSTNVSNSSLKPYESS